MIYKNLQNSSQSGVGRTGWICVISIGPGVVPQLKTISEELDNILLTKRSNTATDD